MGRDGGNEIRKMSQTGLELCFPHEHHSSRCFDIANTKTKPYCFHNPQYHHKTND